MGTTWVLHTETKGTGAQMVPLEKVAQRPKSVEPVFVPRQPAEPREPERPKSKAPRRFRIVDVMTRQHLLDDAGIRDALDVLKDVRSVVDVNIDVWEEERGRWRPLTFEEELAFVDLASQEAAPA
jgi:hypothetical protein